MRDQPAREGLLHQCMPCRHSINHTKLQASITTACTGDRTEAGRRQAQGDKHCHESFGNPTGILHSRR